MAATKKSKMPVSKATNAYELLAEIVALILEEPLRYDQENILIVGGMDQMPACNTVGCVAGWTVALLVPQEHWWKRGIMTAAQEILGLSKEQAAELFSAAAVDDMAREKDPDIKNVPGQTTEHARLGAAHIQRFMRKHAKQLRAKKV